MPIDLGAALAALPLRVGPGTPVLVIAHPIVRLAGHVRWCRKREIDWLTCEPRNRRLALRPRALHDGVTPSVPGAW